MDPITNSDDLIDSRDVIARMEEIEGLFDDGTVPTPEEYEEYEEYEVDNPDLTDEVEEYAALKALAEEASGNPDWIHGETLIRDSYFEEYAREMADSIGAIDSNAAWPLNHIDWEAAARELQADYIAVDFDGERYWIRA